MPPKKKRKVNSKSRGTGFAGGSGDISSIATGMKLALKRQQVQDEKTLTFLLETRQELSHHLSTHELAFSYLSNFLSSEPQSKLESTAGGQSKLSHLQQVLKDVFRGHSPTEWDSKEKSALIHAALGICDVLADGGNVGDITLLSSIMASGEKGERNDDDGEQSESSLLHLLRDIADQANMIAKKSQQLNSNGTDTDDMNVATYFLQVQEKIERNLCQMRGISIGSRADSDSKPSARKEGANGKSNKVKEEEMVYRRELRKLRRVDFVESLGQHSFDRSQKFTGDPRRLYRELMSYQQSLPVEFSTSIFVRVVDNKMNLLRALIIGPDGTPYANGCFFFDIYLPTSYPQRSPQVQFLTTGGGRFRFNPNLYNCGKVCLSLLGTWQGPGWIPNESTLLQVLISIQSLILVNDPYFNEPGWEVERGTSRGRSQSEKYNKGIRRGTAIHAMQFYMKRLCGTVNGTNRDKCTSLHAQHAGVHPEFDDVLVRHFALKANTIRQQISNWGRNGDINTNDESELLAMLGKIETMHRETASLGGETTHRDLFISQQQTWNTTASTAKTKMHTNTSTDTTTSISMDTKEVIELDGIDATCSTSRSKNNQGPRENDVIILDDEGTMLNRGIPQSLMNGQKQRGGVIDLADSDDERMNNSLNGKKGNRVVIDLD